MGFGRWGVWEGLSASPTISMCVYPSRCNSVSNPWPQLGHLVVEKSSLIFPSGSVLRLHVTDGITPWIHLKIAYGKHAHGYGRQDKMCAKYCAVCHCSKCFLLCKFKICTPHHLLQVILKAINQKCTCSAHSVGECMKYTQQLCVEIGTFVTFSSGSQSRQPS